jgi:hypothetical protein
LIVYYFILFLEILTHSSQLKIKYHQQQVPSRYESLHNIGDLLPILEKIFALFLGENGDAKNWG